MLAITVTTVDDVVDANDGLISLREAIVAANSAPGADTIDFAPALTANAPAIIALQHGELVLTETLTIDGPGIGMLTIDSSAGDPTPELDNGDGIRAFYISDGDIATTLVDVTIRGLTVTGGDLMDEGGGIRVHGDNLRLESVDIFENHGGGVSQFRGSLVVIDSAIRKNSSAAFGGIHVSQASASIQSTLLIGNSATDGTGGGLFFSSFRVGPESEASLEVRDSEFIENSARANGGGIAAGNDGPLVVESNQFKDNTARLGGGLYVGGKSAVIRSNSILSNSAEHGGGAYLSSDPRWVGSQVVFADNELIENEAERDGGGLYVRSDATVTITDSDFLGNLAEGDGGGLFFDTAFNLKVKHAFISSTISENRAGRVGGGFSSNAAVAVERTILSGNVAQGSGGIVAWNDLHVLGSVFSGNVAESDDGSGGAISSMRGTLSIERSLFDNNSAGGSGGAVFTSDLHPANSARISNSTFSTNGAGLNGGAIAAASRDLILENSTISGNSARALGGGIWSKDGTTITGSTITLNRADAAGGGVFNEVDELTLNHTIVADNSNVAAPELTGLMTSTIVAHYSLIGRNLGTLLAPAPVGTPDENRNLIGGATLSEKIRPRLEPLADNGGYELPDETRIPTHALLPESPATNAGDPAAVAGQGGVPIHDQRGAPFTRVFGGRIEIGAVESIPAGFLPGDFNLDGAVDTADYSIWRDTLGQSVTSGNGADGNGDGVVDTHDYDVWKSNFGARAEELGAASTATAEFGVVEIRRQDDLLGELNAVFGLAGQTTTAGESGNGSIDPRRRLWVERLGLKQDQILASWAAMESPRRTSWTDAAVDVEANTMRADSHSTDLAFATLGRPLPRLR